MTIKPVLHVSPPKYPDKYGKEMRDVLTGARPWRWQYTPLIGVLSATIALGLSGCVTGQDAPDRVPLQSPPIHGEMPGDPSDQLPIEDSALLATLIPLFEYGEGTGSIGCMAIVAPVFMSEEEAFAILRAAFDEAGLTLGYEADKLLSVNLPLTNIDGEPVDSDATVRGYLVPDGVLAAHDLPVVFVSAGDVFDWHKPIDIGPILSFSSYNVRQAAKTLADNNPGLLVFYDPIATEIDYSEIWDIEQLDGESNEAYFARVDALRDEKMQAAQAESERYLRMQVEAFIAWLGDEGF